jgi:hypothetical protein
MKDKVVEAAKTSSDHAAFGKDNKNQDYIQEYTMIRLNVWNIPTTKLRMLRHIVAYFKS